MPSGGCLGRPNTRHLFSISLLCIFIASPTLCQAPKIILARQVILRHRDDMGLLMNFRDDLLPFILVFCVAMAIGFVAGREFDGHESRDQAVEAGVAEYYLDQNHERQWRWITNR